MAFHFKDAKAEYIGCRHCGSKIARKHLRNNNCPVCGADLRPESTLKAIASAYDSYNKANNRLQEEIKKENAKKRDKAEIRWLVKVEYHS